MSENGSLGVRLARAKTLTGHPDLRGSVTETYRTSWFPDLPPIRQLVRSVSIPNVLRGMHLHRKQWDVWVFVEGRALVRLVDHTTGASEFLSTAGYDAIAIPPGISHGFFTESGCTLMYALTEEYDGSDEFGWYPFDGVGSSTTADWPDRLLPGLVVSERDVRAPRLADFKG